MARVLSFWLGGLGFMLVLSSLLARLLRAVRNQWMGFHFCPCPFDRCELLQLGVITTEGFQQSAGWKPGYFSTP